jgi:uncharacterized membrane protein
MSEERHPKHDFLIERIAFFSDAVFAIAITLMAIEIHPPQVNRGDTDAVVWEKFKEILPQFLGLLVSFWLIASVWLRHHQLFKYVDNFDIGFTAINLLLLFTIILFPFSTGFLFNSIFYGAVTKLQVYFYLGVPLASSLILYRMYKRVNKKHLKGTADIYFRKSVFSQGAMIIAFMLAIIWVVIMPSAYHPLGYTFLCIGPLLSSIYNKKFKKK